MKRGLADIVGKAVGLFLGPESMFCFGVAAAWQSPVLTTGQSRGDGGRASRQCWAAASEVTAGHGNQTHLNPCKSGAASVSCGKYRMCWFVCVFSLRPSAPRRSRHVGQSIPDFPPVCRWCSTALCMWCRWCTIALCRWCTTALCRWCRWCTTVCRWCSTALCRCCLQPCTTCFPGLFSTRRQNNVQLAPQSLLGKWFHCREGGNVWRKELKQSQGLSSPQPWFQFYKAW